MKYYAVLFCLICSFTGARAQDKITGYWTGTMTKEDAVMNVSFEFKYSNGKILGFFNSPIQKASGIPLDNVVSDEKHVSFQLMTQPVTIFKCDISGDKIEGEFSQEGEKTGQINLVRSTPPPKKYSQIDTSFSNGDIKIACRIYIPDSPGKHPAVVFMHGSGPEGMFANQFFAECMAEDGIVTLIQDKRGVGRSTGDWTKAGYEDLANDYIGAVELLRSFEAVNEKQIGIFGHSQGGTIAPLVASESEDISFIISNAATGDTLYKQDLYRVENNLKENDFSSNEIAEAMAYYRSWLDIARSGVGYDKLDSLNNVSKDKKWFGWVEAPPKDNWIWKWYLPVGNFCFLKYWDNVKVPVLLIYGEYDSNTPVSVSLKNIDNSLRVNAGNKDVTEIILPRAQHNLTVSPLKGEKFFWWRVSPGLVDLYSSWILYRFKN